MVVRGGGVSILVDCGVAAKVVARRMRAVGLDIGEVTAVVCTHGHSDHVAGAAVLARRHGVDIYGTPTTVRRIPAEPPRERVQILPMRGVVHIGGLTVRTIPTMHDIAGSVALVVSDGDSQLAVVTDLGRPTRALVEALDGVAALAIEFNHDAEMLRTGPYPEHLKRRVRSDRGHLSNRQSAALLARVAHADLQHVTLLHLSEHNKTPELARSAAQGVLDRLDLRARVSVAEQDRPCAPIALRPNLPRQLAMPWALSPPPVPISGAPRLDPT